MSDAKVSGVVHLIEETKTFGNKGFRKRLVVLELQMSGIGESLSFANSRATQQAPQGTGGGPGSRVAAAAE